MVERYDIGATDKSVTSEVRIFVRHHGRLWRATLYGGSDQSFALDCQDNGFSQWYAPDLNTGAARRVLGHVLRRAICRGIDTCTITETEDTAEIDLGEVVVLRG